MCSQGKVFISDFDTGHVDREWVRLHLVFTFTLLSQAGNFAVPEPARSLRTPRRRSPAPAPRPSRSPPLRLPVMHTSRSKFAQCFTAIVTLIRSLFSAPNARCRSHRAPQTVYTQYRPSMHGCISWTCSAPTRTTRTFDIRPQRNGVAARSSGSHARDRDHRMASDGLGDHRMASDGL